MRKPKIIPKGFIWDPIHKELIDGRCNNKKLKKLCDESVPAMCISPFFPIREVKQDKFEDMLARQKEFQKKYKERFKFNKFLVSLAMLVESFELMLKTEYKRKHNYKWWSKKEVPERPQRVEELADVFHFFMLYMLEEKITVNELYQEYIKKLEENYKRQESGTY